MVKTYWIIGHDIVEEEQRGKIRAEYGNEIIACLSEKLQKEFGKGFSETNIKNMRKFYLIFQNYGYGKIRQTLSDEFKLSWSHYCSLIQISNSLARKFYEQEAIANSWSVREMDRQINSLLFERLAKSKDKKGLLVLAKKGQEINRPEEAIKDPLILEFLGLPESNRLVESAIEEALINNLQNFLLELGKGYAFLARQKRLTLDGKNYYADLVFYHCYSKMLRNNRYLMWCTT